MKPKTNARPRPAATVTTSAVSCGIDGDCSGARTAPSEPAAQTGAGPCAAAAYRGARDPRDLALQFFGSDVPMRNIFRWLAFVLLAEVGAVARRSARRDGARRRRSSPPARRDPDVGGLGLAARR